MNVILHTVAFVSGAILDLIIGDPYSLPHPIRLIGSFIGYLDKKLLPDSLLNSANEKKIKRRGVVLVLLVLLSVFIASALAVTGSYLVHPVLGVIVESILTFYCFAAKSLKVESMKVAKALEAQDTETARFCVSMIVGRDTNCLDETGITKAAVETVAENTSDGVIAPMIYTAIGGPVLGLLYKAVNTMDSMIGYHNDRYEYFGTAAAKTDDFVNFIPARLSAVFIIMAAYLCSLFDKCFNGRNAWKIFKRDRFNHKSPNSAQTESACAGALGILLAGDAVYFGKVVHKPTIGEDMRPIEVEDIKRTNRLMYMSAFLCLMFCLGIIFALFSVFSFLPIG